MELKKRDEEMRAKNENDMIAMLQQHLQQQQVMFVQMQRPNKLSLELLNKNTKK